MTEGRPQAAGRDLGTEVAERLARDIFSGVQLPGSLLPRETDLGELFAVSRASVRSGVQMLVTRGILSRTPGQGTVVREYRDWNLLDPLVTRWMVEYAIPNPEFLREIHDFRHATEPFIAATAATRATARDLLAMEEAFTGMEQSFLSGRLAWQGRGFSDWDVDFHAAMYRATHNLVWAQLAHILRPAIMLVIERSNATADELRDSLERHRALMEAIRLRRPQDAHAAASRVMSRTAHDLGLDGRPAALPLPVP